MVSRLVNVRLDEEHLRKVRELRERGVALADVVRDAINDRYSELSRSLEPGDVRAAVNAVFERFPDEPGLPARGYDVHDRRQARGAIRGRLQRRRR